MASPYIALPKGVTEKSFGAALAEFRRVLGPESVLVSAAELAPYIKTMMPVSDTEHTPSAALLATTVEQVQQIVAICNRYRVPIWPISTGKNLGYGSAAPAERGQVADFERQARYLGASEREAEIDAWRRYVRALSEWRVELDSAGFLAVNTSLQRLA